MPTSEEKIELVNNCLRLQEWDFPFHPAQKAALEDWVNHKLSLYDQLMVTFMQVTSDGPDLLTCLRLGVEAMS